MIFVLLPIDMMCRVRECHLNQRGLFICSANPIDGDRVNFADCFNFLGLIFHVTTATC